MNKKARLYGNSKLAQILKIKDYHQKSNQKQFLNRSAERRIRVIPFQEKNYERHHDSKLRKNKSKNVKLEKNIYNNNTNEKYLKRKDDANTIYTNEKNEENVHIKKDFFKESDNEENYGTYNNRKNLSKIYNNNKTEKKYSQSKNNKIQINNEDEDEKDDEDKEDDIIYRTMYRTSQKNMNKIKEKEEKIKKNKEKENDKKNQSYNDEKILDNKFGTIKEQADILQYNKEDKKIHLNEYNSKNKRRKSSIKKSKLKYDYKDDYKTYSNNFKENDNFYLQKTYEKRNNKNIYDLNTERVVDMFIIDDDYDIKFLTKTKKKINRKNNKFREIIIENYGPNMPMKKDKFTGFIFTRKSNGKKIYKLELPDDIQKINEIFKNEEIMIKNQIIQIIPEQKMLLINNKNQNELKKSQNEKILEKEIEKDKELIKDKERQITLLKNKIEELNNTIKKQAKQITQLEKDMKNIKMTSEQIKDSFQNLENENKSLKSQLQADKMKRKSLQKQIEEESNQTLQEMKDRIQKYKNELRKPSVVEGKEKEYRRSSNVSNIDTQNANNTQEIIKNKNNIRNSTHSVEYKKREEHPNINKNDIDKKEEEGKNNVEEENYEDDYNYGIYDEKDPKAKKMKKAMARFSKKYKDIIIENKKNLKLKENEEKEQEELEKRELEGNDSNPILKEKEEKEKKQKEEQEKREREQIEKERKEKEKKQKEEKERKEKEEKEKKEREKKEKERKEKEEKEKKEKEKKEKEEKEKKDKKILPNKLKPNNFAKTLADKMKVAPIGGLGPKKVNGSIDNNSKPSIIIEKKVDIINLIEDQPFKKESKKKPKRKKFID